MSKKTFYLEHVKEAKLPINKRPETVPARGGNLKKVRRHHIDIHTQEDLRIQAKEKGRFVPPYRRGGGYWGIVETLSLLGENEKHLFADFWKKFIDVMSDPKLAEGKEKTPWENFSNRMVRSKITGKNTVEKVHQNIRVLQRLGGANPYGLKLAQLNACIDVFGNKQEMYLRLRTHIPTGGKVVPIREISLRSFDLNINVPAGYSVTEGTDGAQSMKIAIESATQLAESSSTETLQEMSAEAEGTEEDTELGES